jgi:serine/threonine protein kinase
MIAFQAFAGLYEWNEESNTLGQLSHGGQGTVFKGYDKSNKEEVVIKVTSREFKFSGDIVNDQHSILGEIKRIWEEWTTLLISQFTHTVQVKGLSLHIEPTKDTSIFRLKSYLCMEKLSSDLYDLYIGPKQQMS